MTTVQTPEASDRADVPRSARPLARPVTASEPALPTKRRWAPLAAAILARCAEIAIIGLGLTFTFVLEGEAALIALLWWILLALIYLLSGAVVLRRSRLRPAADALASNRFRFNFLFSLVASLTGLSAALEVALSTSTTEVEQAMEGAGAIAMLLSWLLLHAGYARRYQALYAKDAGLVFPGVAEPARPATVDFCYFAFAVGTAFSTSDVQVVTTRMRWHVMSHSIVSFLYNAAVLAYAIAVLSGR